MANIIIPIMLIDGLEKRIFTKRLTRLDIILMVMFFPMTVLVATVYFIATYSGRITGKILKRKSTKTLIKWLKTPIYKEKRK